MEVTQYHSFIPSEDLSFQQRFWRVQRIGWAVMALIVVAAVLGLLGSAGFLNNATRSTSSLQVQYRPIVRRDTATTYLITFQGQQGSQRQLLIAERLFKQADVRSVSPQPKSVTLVNGFYRYSFASDDDGKLAPVVISAWPGNTVVGPISFQIGTDQAHLQTVNQWELP